jgi:tetratricopeptide (TPR) repeat protein
MIYLELVNRIFIALTCLWLVAAHAASTNPPAARNAVGKPVANLDDPIEKEFQAILAQDDKAQAEVDVWIKENQAFDEKGAGTEKAALNLRIEQRFESVRKAYEDFLLRHSEHARARNAYACMLNDLGLEAEAVVQWEKARDADPKDPAVWNNLANYYGHRGPVTNAFHCCEKAIELRPDQALYYQNLAVIVFLFRADAQEYYQLDEARVFQKALDLYRQAMKLAPKDFVLAQEWAQTYYGIKPPRYEEALAAWNDVLQLAGDQLQREGVYVHQARIEIQLSRFDSASNHLAQVTNNVYQVLKSHLTKNLAAKQAKAVGTNALEAKVTLPGNAAPKVRLDEVMTNAPAAAPPP